MRVTPRRDKDGQVYYSFDYTDPKTKKRIRLKKSEAPFFTDRQQAEAWANSQTAYQEAMKAANARRTAWKSQYYDFKELSKGYVEYQKEQAPNSWERAPHCLDKYVLYWFLDVKKASNINVWHLLYPEFRDWLQKEARTIRKARPLSYSSQNHIIMTLNTFIDWLAKYNKIDPSVRVKCPVHEAHKLGARTFKDVFLKDELDLIYPKLRKIDELTADFFYVILHTGMRFNELYSLPISSLFKGNFKGTLHDELAHHNINYLGYILLESQIEDEARTRKEDHSHHRKALKGRKSISPANSRTIPIIDKVCWNILAKLHKQQMAVYKKQVYGADRLNYLFFEDLPYNAARLNLAEAYDKTGLAPKSYHCLRHTYSTNLVGKTRSFFLAKAILGHKTEKEFDRYCHIFEQIQLAAQQESQEIDLIEDDDIA